jgi:hypothetical protein
MVFSPSLKAMGSDHGELVVRQRGERLLVVDRSAAGRAKSRGRAHEAAARRPSAMSARRPALPASSRWCRRAVKTTL